MPNKYSFNATRGTIDSDITDLIQTWESATIASGAVAFSGSSMTLDTQGAAATDDLDTITATNVLTGFIVWLRSTSTARQVVLKHNTGNLWLHGNDFTLDNPRKIALLIYDGAYWVMIGCCGGQVAEPTEVVPDSGENTLCVVASRIAAYVDYVMDQAAQARAGGLIAVAAAVTAAIQLAQPNADQSAVNALAADIVAEYADDMDIYTAFSATVFDRVQCSSYCSLSMEGGTSEFTEAMIPLIVAYLGYFSGVPYEIIADIVTIIGPDGLTRAVGLSVLEATTLDCADSNECVCSVEFEWESASSSGVKTCTVTPDVVLRINGGSTLPASITVDIVASGSATGSGTDYTLNTTSVTFPAGSGDGDTQAVSVTVTSGATTSETIVLDLDPETGIVGNVATHTITIATQDTITWDFSASDGDYVVAEYNGFWETGNGWRTGTTSQLIGGLNAYRVRAEYTFEQPVNITQMNSTIDGGFADAEVYYFDEDDTLIGTWTISASGTSGLKNNTDFTDRNGVKKIQFRRSVLTGAYTGPAYWTMLEAIFTGCS